MRTDMRTHNRILSMLDQTVRQTNQDIIDPMVSELTVDKVQPLVEVTARIRGRYLKELLKVAKACKDTLPTNDQIKKLRGLRLAYEELAHGFQALDTAIERGYLTVAETEPENK